MTLDAVCTSTGIVMRLLHPLIVVAMRRHDGGQIKALAEALTGEQATGTGAAGPRSRITYRGSF